MLLYVIRGRTNISDLIIVDGQEIATFRQVFEKMRLLEDNHWDATIEEAVLCRSPAKDSKDHNVALAVASFGSAAILLSGERTAHSVFKLPFDLANEETPTCNISESSARGILLQQCKLIEAYDRCLQDIHSYQTLMNDVVVLLTGDFRQTLPVIERGTAADEIQACLKSYSHIYGRKFKSCTSPLTCVSSYSVI
ncbi:unnamed protein product [Euphydryas editha]|uniref:ATP-dependent DNA helicase n=1 Tax=Euphydryas editha TaxID=104508 RepID=A0AAU9UTM8_EUPED|nr:unnamed protein product [Euphydryas editha]